MLRNIYIKNIGFNKEDFDGGLFVVSPADEALLEGLAKKDSETLTRTN